MDTKYLKFAHMLKQIHVQGKLTQYSSILEQLSYCMNMADRAVTHYCIGFWIPGIRW